MRSFQTLTEKTGGLLQDQTSSIQIQQAAAIQTIQTQSQPLQIIAWNTVVLHDSYHTMNPTAPNPLRTKGFTSSL